MIIPEYRILWTWDYTTCWDSSYFARGRGSSGQSVRREAFLQDYCRLIDFAHAHHYNGVVIWGAVRAHHNGMQQLKELVRYGRERGVRVLPGVSAFGYGGVCYDPRINFDGMTDLPMESHPYSLYTWLQKHPEYAAVDQNGKPYGFGPLNAVACPSRNENVEWFKEALSWLYEEFDVDGVQVEVGDYAVCHCPLCRQRRKNMRTQACFSVADMISTYTAAIETSHAAKPDAWVICETYSSIADNRCDTVNGWNSMPKADRDLLQALPPRGILQWGVDKALGGFAAQTWPDEIYTPAADNILRIHAGSQHSQNGPADWGVSLVWEMVKNARTHNLNGVSIFGEESAFSPANEANYLALEEACGLGHPNPNCDEALFYAQTLDPLYGGKGMAVRWRELYIKASMLLLGQRVQARKNSMQPLELLTGDPDFRSKALTLSQTDRAQAVQAYYREARALSASLSGDCCGRWSWLENKLWNIQYLLTTRPQG